MKKSQIDQEARSVNGVKITQSEFDYMGSITIDKKIMEASGFLPFQKIYIHDIDNGQHLWTYAIEGDAGTGIICLNGSIARKVTVPDTLKLHTAMRVSEDTADEAKKGIVTVSNGNKTVITQQAAVLPQHDVEMLHSKIHCATVHYAEDIPNEYIVIGQKLRKAAGLHDGQRVDIYNKTGGKRYTATVKAGEQEGMFISPHGTDARKIRNKDIVILCAYTSMDYEQAKTHKPPLVFVDKENNVKKVDHPKTEPVHLLGVANKSQQSGNFIAQSKL